MLVRTFILLVFAVSASNQPVGKVKKVKGNVEILRAGTGPVVKAVVDLPVFEGDIVKTGKYSEVEIIVQGSRIIIYENSEMKIETKKIEYSPTKEKLYSFFKVTIGKIKALFKKMGEKEGTAVASPASVIGIRGTEITMGVAVDGSTVIEVEEGKVELNGGETEIEEGNRYIFDVIEGAKVQPLTIPFNYNEWAQRKVKEFQKKQMELLKAINRVMQQRLEKYKSFVEGIDKLKKEDEIKSGIEEGLELSEMLDHGFKTYKSKGLKVEGEDRFRKVQKRFYEVQKAVQKRLLMKERRIQQKLLEKQRRIEERFREIEKRMK